MYWQPHCPPIDSSHPAPFHWRVVSETRYRWFPGKLSICTTSLHSHCGVGLGHPQLCELLLCCPYSNFNELESNYRDDDEAPNFGQASRLTSYDCCSSSVPVLRRAIQVPQLSAPIPSNQIANTAMTPIKGTYVSRPTATTVTTIAANACHTAGLG